jgi:hypothetical protein
MGERDDGGTVGPEKLVLSYNRDWTHQTVGTLDMSSVCAENNG